MGTTTPNFALYKPATSDVVNVVTDINNNMDSVDTALQNLTTGSATGYVKLLGGKVRTAGNTAALSTTETIVCDSGTIALPASSLIEVRCNVDYFTGGAAGEDWDFSIRETNLAGTRVREVIDKVNPGSLPLNWQFSYFFKTTSAVSKFYVLTIVRVGGTTATMTVQNGTSVRVYSHGPSSLQADF